MPKSTCGSCGTIFTSTTSFDNHRVGSFGDAIYANEKQRQLRHTSGRTAHTRRCMTPAEMLATGKFAIERKVIRVLRDGITTSIERDIWYEPAARDVLRQVYTENNENAAD